MANQTGLDDGVAETLTVPRRNAARKAAHVGARIGCDGSTADRGNARAPQSITFAVPGQPQGKGRPRVGKVGTHARLFTPKKTVAYEGLIALAAQSAMAGAPMLEGPVSCVLFIDCQVPESWSGRKRQAALKGSLMPTTKPDTDNVVKAVFDGCNGVTFKDDVQVVELHVRKQYRATPGLRVVLARVLPEGGLL
jgi:Holliday junction resolvase RusA-like endonuclease